MKRLKIKGKWWRIYFKKIVIDDYGNQVAGTCNFKNRNIEICTEQDKEDVADSIFHEIMHAAGFECGRMQQTISGDHEHFVIDSSCSTIVDNARYLISVLKEIHK